MIIMITMMVRLKLASSGDSWSVQLEVHYLQVFSSVCIRSNRR